jgi:hypothetical protein
VVLPPDQRVEPEPVQPRADQAVQRRQQGHGGPRGDHEPAASMGSHGRPREADEMRDTKAVHFHAAPESSQLLVLEPSRHHHPGAGDETALDVTISYVGAPLILLHTGVHHRPLVEERAFSYGLADVLTGVHPDRMAGHVRGDQVAITLTFEP